MKKNKIIIYTDGAARGNPGPSGWGAIILNYELRIKNYELKKTIEIGGRNEHATNNIMELTAAIEALKYVKKLTRQVPTRQDLVTRSCLVGTVEIFSDSKYVILGITEWIENWMKNGWRNAAKKPVLNRELWERLYELNEEFSPTWKYVAGHNGDKYNERADEIATSFADGEPVKLSK